MYFIILQELEEAVIIDSNTDYDENPGLLIILLIRLLKGVFKKSINTDNYHMFLRRFLNNKCKVSLEFSNKIQIANNSITFN